MINARTKAGIEKAKLDGVKFGRTTGSTNKTTAAKLEKIRIYLGVGKSYDWISKELAVSKKTIADIKKSLSSLNSQLASQSKPVELPLPASHRSVRDSLLSYGSY
jgi:DNA invertase Pin-like site-specific DNA recombinase